MTPTPLGPPRRIMFVIPSLHGGGAEFVARTWMGWLVDRGYEVSVVLTGGQVDRSHLPIGVHAASVSTRRGHLAKSGALRHAILGKRPDAVIALQAYPNLALLTAARLIPASRRPKVLISERNLVSLGLPGADLSHRIKVEVARQLYRSADHVIAISHPVAGELVAGFHVPGSRITVVPNPAMAKVDTTRHRHRSPGSEHGVQVVLACRLVAQKRPLLAVEAVAELSRRGIAAELVSFGGGPMLEQVQAAAASAGVRFIHHGWVENWFDHFGDNAVALLPSTREGFGNVLVEAAAAGYPSVAVSGALGVADAIVPGITGELALTASAVDIADAIVRASELTLDGIDPWLRRFSVESSGTDLERVLAAVFGRESR